MVKRKFFWIGIIILLSWGLEYLWAVHHQSFHFRFLGLHLIPLFLLPLIVLFAKETISLKQLFITTGLFRWWLTAFVLPIIILGGCYLILYFLKYITFSDLLNPETKLLALAVDAPLNFILWFFSIVGIEACWRAFFIGKKNIRIRRAGFFSPVVHF